MSYEDESEWSDSDDGSQQQTSVLLGLPDGEIKDPKDLRDPNVSRLGGKPVRPYCNSTSHIRAFRQLRFNDKYAAKLEKRKERAQREKEKEAKAAAAASGLNTNAASNPFSMGGGSVSGPTNLFGSGFGGAEEEAEEEDLASGGSEDDYDYEDEDEPEVDALADKLTSTTITEQTPASTQNEWASHPFYPPIYLNTVFEYISPPKPSPAQKSAAGNGAGGEMWDLEQYERASDEDPVFHRFAQRVGEEGSQYELGGTPLPFHTDDVYKKLFPPAPIAPGTQVPVTGPSPASKPTYDPTVIPLCEHCGGKRIFECQLMPNVLNALKKPLPKTKRSATETEEARKKLVAAALGGQGGVGMEWGTCMVFACAKDCDDGRETWREEEVWVQWER